MEDIINKLKNIISRISLDDVEKLCFTYALNYEDVKQFLRITNLTGIAGEIEDIASEVEEMGNNLEDCKGIVDDVEKFLTDYIEIDALRKLPTSEIMEELSCIIKEGIE